MQVSSKSRRSHVGRVGEAPPQGWVRSYFDIGDHEIAWAEHTGTERQTYEAHAGLYAVPSLQDSRLWMRNPHGWMRCEIFVPPDPSWCL